MPRLDANRRLGSDVAGLAGTLVHNQNPFSTLVSLLLEEWIHPSTPREVHGQLYVPRSPHRAHHQLLSELCSAPNDRDDPGRSQLASDLIAHNRGTRRNSGALPTQEGLATSTAMEFVAKRSSICCGTPTGDAGRRRTHRATRAGSRAAVESKSSILAPACRGRLAKCFARTFRSRGTPWFADDAALIRITGQPGANEVKGLPFSRETCRRPARA